jgi:ATP-binding cassette subfamily F protein 3
VKPYDGDIDGYRAELLAERGNRSRAASDVAADLDTDTRATSQSRADQRRAAAERRAELAPLKKAMEKAEKDVARLTAEIAKLDAVLADADLYAKTPERAQKAAIDRGQLAKRLAEAEEAWLAAGSAYEAASADAPA